MVILEIKIYEKQINFFKNKFLNSFFFFLSYIKMYKDSSAKCYQKNK